MTKNICEDLNIIASTVTFTEDYDEPNGARLLAYWRELKGDRDRPLWSQFDFLDIVETAPLLIIKDVIDGGAEFRNRYWGTEHVEMDHFDGTGKVFADFYKPEDIPDILKLYRQPLATLLPMVMRGTLHYQEASSWREYSSLCVGFTDQNGAVDKLVTAYDL